MTCDNPEEGANAVTENTQPGFRGLVGGYGDGGEGDALASENQSRDRFGSGDMIV